MLAYYGSAISGNITETPEGFLICKNVPIARTGVQEYLENEIGLDGDRLVKVHRVESEVFNPAAIASFEGKPVTHEHPSDSVEPNNISAYGKGHVQNVRRGSGQESDLLIADLFITDSELIDQIMEHKIREVSCGYECEYHQDDVGRYYQCRIRGNHVAVVASGRAGSRVAIRDSKEVSNTKNERGKTKMVDKKKNVSLFARVFTKWAQDSDPEEVAGAVDELMEGEETKPVDAAPSSTPAPVAEPPAKDFDPILQKIMERLDAIEAKMTSGVSGDEDPLTKLENDIVAGGEEMRPEADADNGEEAVTVPADELPDPEQMDACGRDEDETQMTPMDEEPFVAPESEKPENPIKGADARVMLAAIDAIKPIIAKLPENQRRAAADAASKKIRAAMGKDAKPRSNGYAAINRTMRSAHKDSARKTVDESALGKKIMAKYNPHYKEVK